MKITKRKKMLLGLAASTLFTVTGCPFNQEPDVYGMPDRGLYDDSNIDVNNNQVEDVYGPPIDEIDPDNNEIEGVYGPPQWFDDGPDISPDDNELDDVYGPPEWFDGTEPDDNMEPNVYGPPEWFENDMDPDRNITEPVYGPPPEEE